MEEMVRQAVLQAEIAASEATENSMRFYDEKLLERQQLALSIQRTGFITRLDFYNLEKVFSFQRRRLEHGRPIVPISVNQSRLHLNEPDYLPKWGMNFP